MQENIVEKFKKTAKELSELYRARKKLNKIILDYETNLKDLGEVLEFADSFETCFKEIDGIESRL